MTSENELDIIKTLDTTNENQQELISSNKDQSISEEPIAEQINIEKPKRPGRKKRDVISGDNSLDTQPLFEQPIILEGKRSRKPTSRLELSDLETPKKELSIPQVNTHTHTHFYFFSHNSSSKSFVFLCLQGHGKPLGEIEYSMSKKLYSKE